MSQTIIYTLAKSGPNTMEVDTKATAKAAAEAIAIAETAVKAQSPAKTVDFTKGYLRVPISKFRAITLDPKTNTYKQSQASQMPMAWALAVHCANDLLRRDKSLQWQDAIQTCDTALLESGHDPCKPLPADGAIRIPAGLVGTIKRQLRLQAAPENGLSRGADSHESATRKATRDRITKLAKRLQSNPMSIAAKALDLGLFPKLNAFDIYRKLEDLPKDWATWSKAVAYATPKISQKGISSLAEARGTTPIKSVIYGPDGGNPTPSESQSYGYAN